MPTETENRGRDAQGKHTPGPWNVRLDDAEKVEANDGEGVAVMSGGHRGTAERAANARLIAAAPDMLTVLREIAEHGTDDWDARMETVLAAIRKAEGGAS